MRMTPVQLVPLVRAGLAAAVVGLCLMASTRTPAAADLPRPNGPVILTVSGAIGHRNSDAGAEFDRDMLYDLGIAAVRTSTPWTEGAPTFTGVLMRRVLERVGAHGAVVRAVALNDYAFEIPITDFEQHRVLLAAEMDGEALTVRDKGPLWIVYPLDDMGGRDRLIERKMVWQLVELQVR